MTAKTSNVVPHYDYSFNDLLAKCYDLAKKERGIQIEVGLILWELRERIEAGEKGQIKWWAWYEENLLSVRSRSYAESVMALAKKENPKAALEERKAADRERKRTAPPKLRVVSPTQPLKGGSDAELNSTGSQWKNGENSPTKSNSAAAPQQKNDTPEVVGAVPAGSDGPDLTEDDRLLDEALRLVAGLTFAGWNQLFVRLRQVYRAKFGGK